MNEHHGGPSYGVSDVIPVRAMRAHSTTTLRRIDVQPLRWAAYRGTAPDDLLDEAAALCRDLSGARILQLNATAYGGGVAELLSSEIALMAGGGVSVEWRVICPDDELFRVTKKLHNGMQGLDVALSGDDRRIYEERSAHCAAMLADEWDLIVVHDPQPAPLIQMATVSGARWVWRCHIDTSTPDAAIWDLLRPYLSGYHATVFTLDEFRPRDLPANGSWSIAPAIDPRSAKNRPLPRFVAREIVAQTGVDLARPLVVQVARFDPWKDPLGVIDAWRLARERIPGVQLALVGAMADDDPEGWEIYARAADASAGEPDCHLLTNQTGIGPVEVNAFQRQADVVVQKSLREGFGLTVSEALWKGTPVVGGRAGGIPLQIGGDGEAGLLVDDVEACAGAMVSMLEDAEAADRMGLRGRERVRRDFLIPRLARDDLALYRSVLASGRD
jgi:trehalose synthase